MKAYFRIDPLLDERKADYTPAQLGAFVKVMLMAGRQKHRGRFKSMKHLVGGLPAAYAKHVPHLVAEGDIIESGRGEVYVDGWDEWQEGDHTVAERMVRLRNRQRREP